MGHVGLRLHLRSRNRLSHTGDLGVISLAGASLSHLMGIEQDLGEFVVDFGCSSVVAGSVAF